MKAISIFAGAGGFDLGARSLGIDIVRSVERDADCCATLAAAGFHPVQADVGDLDKWAHDLPPIDLLFGGPPCQPFSTAGVQQGGADARDGFPVALAAAAYLRPRWLVLENVSGFLSPQFATYRHDLLSKIRALYPVVTCWRLNAADFGVPQERIRVFIVAGPSKPAQPTRTHADPRKPSLWGLPKWVGWRAATGVEAPTSADNWLDMPSPTIATTGGGLGGRYARRRCGREIGREMPTLSQSTILQDFPADYPFVGSAESRLRQVGNAVPMRLGAAVLGAVLRADRVPRE